MAIFRTTFPSCDEFHKVCTRFFHICIEITAFEMETLNAVKVDHHNAINTIPTQ